MNYSEVEKAKIVLLHAKLCNMKTAGKHILSLTQDERDLLIEKVLPEFIMMKETGGLM